MKQLIRFCLLPLSVSLLPLAGMAQAFCRSYGQPGVTSSGNDIQRCPGGGYIIAGSTASGGGDALLIRIAENGDELWSRTYGGPHTETGTSVAVLDNGFLLAGTRLSGFDSFYDLYVVKTDLNGDTVWTKTIAWPGWDILVRMNALADGSFVTCSNVLTDSGGIVLVRKFNPDGTERWHTGVNDPTADQVRDMIINTAGEIIITGDCMDTLLQTTDIYIAAFSPEGEQLFMTRSGTPQNEIAGGVTVNAAGEIIVSATTVHRPDKREVFLARYAADGEEEYVSPEITPHDRVMGRICSEGDRLVPALTFFYGANIRTAYYYEFTQDFYWICSTGIHGQLASDANGIIIGADNTRVLVGSTELHAPGHSSVFVLKSDIDCNNPPISLAVEDKPKQVLQVYPNPASDRVHISLPVDMPKNATRYRLTDVTGREHPVVFHPGSGETIIYTASLLPGIYQLFVSSDQRPVMSTKIIVAR